MTHATAESGAALSVILPTDRHETVRAVIESLRRQTASDRIEVILVVPEARAAGADSLDGRGFAALHVIEAGSITPLPRARALGVRVATAPLVFMAESHAYPHPGWAEALINAADREAWSVIAPAFRNMNPDSPASWAAFLMHYGNWQEELPRGEIAAPGTKGTYRRAVLLELDGRLDRALSSGDELVIETTRRGHRTYFEPAAILDHANTATARGWLYECYLLGMMVGAYRGERWPRARRVAYALAAPLAAAVLAGRTMRSARRTARTRRLPAGVVPLIVLGAIVQSAGEAIGYARGVDLATEARADACDLHKGDDIARHMFVGSEQ